MLQQLENILLSILNTWKSRFTPFLKWLPLLKNSDVLRTDLIAGITVALVLIPQSMAYAQLAGLPPYVGLYASFLPVIIAALFGSSRQLATGPVAIVSLMSATALATYVSPESNLSTYLAYAAFLAILVGLFQLTLGLLKLGFLVDFLSHPVIIGFTNAAALIIASSQVTKLFGLSLAKEEHQYEYVWNIIMAIPDSHIVTILMGMLSLSLLVVIKKWAPKLPTILITVIVCTLVSWLTGYHAQFNGDVVGDIPAGLPSITLPSIELNDLMALTLSAIVIGLIGFVEAISIAKAVASQTRQRISANQELIGQGLSNITSGLSSGYAVSGSFSRSAINFSANATTGFSSIVTGVIVAITLLFLTPLLYHLPQATLAAVIIVAVLGLIKIQPIIHAFRVEPHDGIVAMAVFCVTLFVAPHLETGIIVGVFLSLGLFIYRTMEPKMIEVARHEDKILRNAQRFNLKTSDNVAIFRFNGDLYFASAGYMEGKTLKIIADKPNLKALILDIGSVNQVDDTGEQTLRVLFDRLKAVDIDMYLVHTNVNVLNTFKRSGLVNHMGQDHFYSTSTLACLYLKEKLGDTIDVEPYLKPIYLDKPS